jgi:hypothetical protein
LEQLPVKLELGENPTIEAVQRRLKQIEGEAKAASVKLAGASQTHERSLERVQEEIRDNWPELHSTYHPLAMALTSERAEEFVEHVNKSAAYKSLVQAAALQKEETEAQMKLTRDEARLQRLMATCEDVVRAANLPFVAPNEIVTKYQRIVTMEEGTLSGKPTAPVESN